MLDTAQKGALQWWKSRTYLRKFLYFLLLCLHQVASSWWLWISVESWFLFLSVQQTSQERRCSGVSYTALSPARFIHHQQDTSALQHLPAAFQGCDTKQRCLTDCPQPTDLGWRAVLSLRCHRDLALKAASQPRRDDSSTHCSRLSCKKSSCLPWQGCGWAL